MQKKQPPCWIETTDLKDAEPEVQAIYQQLSSRYNKVHHLYLAFSLQPKPLRAADQHYRDIMQNEKNLSEPWFLELLSVQVAIIADCLYAFTHHSANFRSLLADTLLADKMIEAVRTENFTDNTLFSNKHAALLAFGSKLSRTPEKMNFCDIDRLRKAGTKDVEILEAVQATASFAYWVRFINALGIDLGDESIGIY